jgi:hypothetical protein
MGPWVQKPAGSSDDRDDNAARQCKDSIVIGMGPHQRFNNRGFHQMTRLGQAGGKAGKLAQKVLQMPGKKTA